MGGKGYTQMPNVLAVALEKIQVTSCSEQESARHSQEPRSVTHVTSDHASTFDNKVSCTNVIYTY